MQHFRQAVTFAVLDLGQLHRQGPQLPGAALELRIKAFQFLRSLAQRLLGQLPPPDLLLQLVDRLHQLACPRLDPQLEFGVTPLEGLFHPLALGHVHRHGDPANHRSPCVQKGGGAGLREPPPPAGQKDLELLGRDRAVLVDGPLQGQLDVAHLPAVPEEPQFPAQRVHVGSRGRHVVFRTHLELLQRGGIPGDVLAGGVLREDHTDGQGMHQGLEPTCGRGKLLLGLFDVRDVRGDAPHARHPPLPIADGHGLIADPPDLAVGTDDPVFLMIGGSSPLDERG